MKNPPILIAVLGFFGLMTAFYYIFAGLRIIGFDWFGVFADAPATQGYWFWGALWVIVGIFFAAASVALWGLQSWAWMVAVILSIVGLVSAFVVMFDAGLAAGLGAALLPGIILWYLYTPEVRSQFGVQKTDAG
jgi:hypothetical protein